MGGSQASEALFLSLVAWAVCRLWGPCSLALRAPSGAHFLPLLLCAHSCHRDVVSALQYSVGAADAWVSWVFLCLMGLLLPKLLVCVSIHPGATFLHVYSYRCSTWRPIMHFHLCSVLLSFSFHLFPLPFFLALFLVPVNSGNAVLDMHSCE